MRIAPRKILPRVVLSSSHLRSYRSREASAFSLCMLTGCWTQAIGVGLMRVVQSRGARRSRSICSSECSIVAESSKGSIFWQDRLDYGHHFVHTMNQEWGCDVFRHGSYRESRFVMLIVSRFARTSR